MKPSQRIEIARVIGLTAFHNAAFSVHKNIMAYPAGRVVVQHNAQNNKQETFYNLVNKSVTATAFSKSGNLLAVGESCDQDSEQDVNVCIYRRNLSGNELAFCLRNYHLYSVNALAFSPDERYIVSVGFIVSDEDTSKVGHAALIWELPSSLSNNIQEPVCVFKILCSKMINGAMFSDDGKSVILVGDGTVKMYTVRESGIRTSDMSSALINNNRFGNIVGVCSEHSNYYTISNRGMVRMFTSKGQCTWERELSVTLTCVDCCNDMFAVGTDTGQIMFFDTRKRRKVHTLSIKDSNLFLSSRPNDMPVICMRFVTFARKTMLAVVYGDRSLVVWKWNTTRSSLGFGMTNFKQHITLSHHHGCIWDIQAFPPAALESRERQINERDRSKSKGWLDQSLGDSVMLNKIQNEEVPMFATCSSDGSVRLWSSRHGSLNVTSSLCEYPTGKPENLCRPTARSEGVMPEEEKADSALLSLAIHAGGEHLAVGDKNGRINVYDINDANPGTSQSGTPVRVLQVPGTDHRKDVLSLQYLPDKNSKVLAAGAMNSTVTLFAGNDGLGDYGFAEVLDDHGSDGGRVNLVRFSGNGEVLLSHSCGSADENNSIFSSELQNGKWSNAHSIDISRLQKQGTIYDMQVDHEGKGFYCVTQAGAFSRFPGRTLYAESSKSKRTSLTSIAFDRSYTVAAVASLEDSRFRLIDLLMSPRGQQNVIHSAASGHADLSGLAFTADFKFLVTVGADGIIIMHKLGEKLQYEMRNKCEKQALIKKQLENLKMVNVPNVAPVSAIPPPVPTQNIPQGIPPPMLPQHAQQGIPPPVLPVQQVQQGITPPLLPPPTGASSGLAPPTPIDDISALPLPSPIQADSPDVLSQQKQKSSSSSSLKSSTSVWNNETKMEDSPIKNNEINISKSPIISPRAVPPAWAQTHGSEEVMELPKTPSVAGNHKSKSSWGTPQIPVIDEITTCMLSMEDGNWLRMAKQSTLDAKMTPTVIAKGTSDDDTDTDVNEEDLDFCEVGGEDMVSTPAVNPLRQSLARSSFAALKRRSEEVCIDDMDDFSIDIDESSFEVPSWSDTFDAQPPVTPIGSTPKAFACPKVDDTPPPTTKKADKPKMGSSDDSSFSSKSTTSMSEDSSPSKTSKSSTGLLKLLRSKRGGAHSRNRPRLNIRDLHKATTADNSPAKSLASTTTSNTNTDLVTELSSEVYNKQPVSPIRLETSSPSKSTISSSKSKSSISNEDKTKQLQQQKLRKLQLLRKALKSDLKEDKDMIDETEIVTTTTNNSSNSADGDADANKNITTTGENNNNEDMKDKSQSDVIDVVLDLSTAASSSAPKRTQSFSKPRPSSPNVDKSNDDHSQNNKSKLLKKQNSLGDLKISTKDVDDKNNTAESSYSNDYFESKHSPSEQNDNTQDSFVPTTPKTPKNSKTNKEVGSSEKIPLPLKLDQNTNASLALPEAVAQTAFDTNNMFPLSPAGTQQGINNNLKKKKYIDDDSTVSNSIQVDHGIISTRLNSDTPSYFDENNTDEVITSAPTPPPISKEEKPAILPNEEKPQNIVEKEQIDPLSEVLSLQESVTSCLSDYQTSPSGDIAAVLESIHSSIGRVLGIQVQLPVPQPQRTPEQLLNKFSINFTSKLSSMIPSLLRESMKTTLDAVAVTTPPIVPSSSSSSSNIKSSKAKANCKINRSSHHPFESPSDISSLSHVSSQNNQQQEEVVEMAF